MRRRHFIAALGGAAFARPLATRAAEKVWHIGLFHVGLDHVPPSLATLRTRLRELGYIEGKNLNFNWHNQADEEQARQTARAFVADGVDLIVAFEDQTARAAKAATSRIPIVFVHVSDDPIAASYVSSLAHPGGNMTGVVSLFDIVDKRLELFKQIVPALARVMVLIDPDDPLAPRELAITRDAAAKLHVELLEREAKTPEAAERAFAALQPGEADGVLTASPNLQTKFMATIVRLSWAHHLPLAGHRREWVQQENGALFSYAADLAPAGAVVARYIDDIFKGTAPGELPVQRLDNIHFVLNLKVARAFNIAVPEVTIARADEVIE
jgi:putative tryptophan/tyrosine transport system substrate-binding protein